MSTSAVFIANDLLNIKAEMFLLPRCIRYKNSADLIKNIS